MITLQGTLVENVILPSNVSLRGPATLTAKSDGPAVTIGSAAAGATRTTDVLVQNLVLSGSGAYTGDGGVVLVQAADRVTVQGCELRDSQAGRGGGLALLGSTAVAVRDCKIHDNTAGTPATTLAGAHIRPVTGIALPTSHGNGGGIFTCDTDAEITGCDVLENQAILAGGGIAIANDQRAGAVVLVRDCQITCNQVSHPPFGPLGAAVPIKRADIGDPVSDAFRGGVVSDASLPQLVALLHGLNFESGLGGGISIRNANAVTVSGCSIGVTRARVAAGNRARSGGGISCYIGGYPTIENNEIANNVVGGDGGGIAIDQFDPLLPLGTASVFGVNAIPMVPRRTIVVNGNRIHDNMALEDGGGVYCTGNVQLAVKGGVVTRNQSVEDGGGVRATYASNLYMEGVAITNNQCNVDGSGSDAGGGVSSRNSCVTLKDCELSGNVTNNFAGGAVYFAAMWEGGIEGLVIPSRVANKESTFDAIMAGAFGFHTRVLRLIDCHGSGNQALGDRGAGGFLYAVRSADAGPDRILGGGEPMWVDIEGAKTSIGSNTSMHSANGMRKRGNVVIELSNTRVGATLEPQDRVWIGPEVATIAQSTPATPVASQARALVVMVDTDPSHDTSQLTWGGAGYNFGRTPTITAVAPAAASTAGGTALTISVTKFEDGMTVLVGGASAALGAHTATTLTVTSPPGPAGPADVTVISPSGARATRAAAVTLATP